MDKKLEDRLEIMKRELKEREKVLQTMDKNSPFYDVLYLGYLERKEKYDLMRGERK
jgi:hypothetical protein